MFDIKNVSPATLSDLELMSSGDMFRAPVSEDDLIFFRAESNYKAVCEELRRRGMKVRDLVDRETTFDPWKKPE